MKGKIIILGFAIMAIMVACAMTPKNPNPNNPEPNKKTETPQSKAPVDTANVKLVKFRLEYQSAAGKQCKTSAVLSVDQGKYHDFLYFRDMGAYEGWSYDLDSGVCKQLLEELTRIAKKKNLFSYSYTDLDDEDVERPRWLVTMRTDDEKDLSIVEYSDGSELFKLVEAAFKPIRKSIGDQEIMGPYSHYHYKSDGSLSYRTDHEADGVVHGGYDPDDPLATF